MGVTRRNFGLGAAALALSACGRRAPVQVQRSAPIAVDLQPISNPGYANWVANFRARATAQGISENTLNTAFRHAGYLPGVVTRDRNQIDTKRSLEDYLSIAVSDERVAKGRAKAAQYGTTLAAIEREYGVDANLVTAIWGLESLYGERRGDISVIAATSTLAFDGRRGAFFESQLLAALEIVQRGDIAADKMTGSWAGAMGHTQFIPTTFAAYAVDFTGDGRRDIWADDPTDALASTAAYLARSGWQRGQRWGGVAGQGGTGGDVLQPQAGGPQFSVARNFRVIKRYNNSDPYALGVGLLSDRIAGASPHNFRFPPDEFGLVKSDRIALQRGLAARGYDIGTIDGVIGAKTNSAISAFQAQNGMAVTGQPSQAILARLT